MNPKKKLSSFVLTSLVLLTGATINTLVAQELLKQTNPNQEVVDPDLSRFAFGTGLEPNEANVRAVLQAPPKTYYSQAIRSAIQVSQYYIKDAQERTRLVKELAFMPNQEQMVQLDAAAYLVKHDPETARQLLSSLKQKGRTSFEKLEAVRYLQTLGEKPDLELLRREAFHKEALTGWTLKKIVELCIQKNDTESLLQIAKLLEQKPESFKDTSKLIRDHLAGSHGSVPTVTD